MPSVITPCGGSGGGDWTLLQSLGSSIAVTSFNFTGIDQTGTHLALVLSCRSTRAAPNTADYVRVRFNNDTTAVYYSQLLYGQAATPAAQEFLGETRGRIGYAPAVSSPNYVQGSFVVWIPFYTSTTAAKQWVADNTGALGTTTGNVLRTAFGGVWLLSPPAALTRIEVTPDVGAFFEANSAASLYMLS